MSQPADRNLLFGILALQNDLVTRDQLLEAMNAWANVKDRSLGEMLVERGALSQEHCRLLNQLLDAHIRCHGSIEHSLAACELTSSVRSVVERVADADVHATLSILKGSDARDAAATAALPSQEPRSHGAAGVPEAVRYRVLRPHAKGGLGEVFVAEDLELHREVALKEIQRQHADQDASRGRFVLEAEITGGLEHPGIVPVYGLGTYADGRPFYAMRFIKGDNLKHASDRFHQAGARFDSLEFRQLLGRFIDVCNAVAYAHSRGVLHRDLKPGNIMLGKFGETLVVDWGLAKVVGRTDVASEEPSLVPASGSGVAETMQGVAIGTPAFMSPEQASGKIAELGPATDVYSLGATLYALLTNRAPVSDDDLVRVLDKVRAGEIPHPREANAAIPKPLEAICLKAMARDPSDRYTTALALAADLEQWLADEPVACYREPFSVRAARWIKHHRTLVTSGAVAMLLLLTSVTAGLVLVSQYNRQLNVEKGKTEAANVRLADEKQKVEAVNGQLAQTNRDLEKANEQERAAREQAESILRFFEDKVLAAARPKDEDGGLGIDATIRAAVDAAEPQIAEAFARQPLVEGAIRATLGVTYFYLREPQLAIKQSSLARTLALANLGPNHPRTLACQNHLANAYLAAGEFDKAVQLLEDTYTIQRTTVGAHHTDTLGTMNNLAAAYRSAGHLDKALPIYEEVLQARKETLGSHDPNTLTSINNLAGAYKESGRVGESIAALEQALPWMKEEWGADHPNTLTLMNNLAESYLVVSRWQEALKILEVTVKLSTEKLGRNHPATLGALCNLAEAYRCSGRLDKSISILEETLSASQTRLGKDHPQTLVVMSNLAAAYQAVGRVDDGLHMSEETYSLTKDKLGPDHPDTILSLASLAQAYAHANRLSEALKIYDTTLIKLAQEKLGPDHRNTLTFLTNQADAYVAAGRTKEALLILEDTLQRVRDTFGADHAQTLATMSSLAEAYRSVGRLNDALPLMEEALKLRKAKPGADQTAVLTAMNNLATAYQNAGRLNDAVPLLEELVARTKEHVGADHPMALITTQNLAFAYQAANRLDEAIRLFEESTQKLKEKLGPKHPSTLTGMNNLARAYQQSGHLEQALPIFEETLTLRKATLGPTHRQTLGSMANLANALNAAGRQDAALPLLEQTTALMKEHLGLDHPDTLVAMGNLANAYRQVGRVQEALPILEETFSRMKATLSPPHHPFILRTMGDLAATYLATEQADKSLALYEQLASAHRSSARADDPDFAGVLAQIGTELLKHEQSAAAEPYLRECLGIRERVLADQWVLFNTRSMLGGSLVAQAKARIGSDPEAAARLLAEAEPLLTGGYEGMKQREAVIPPGARSRLTEALQRLVDLYTLWAKPDDAAKWQQVLDAAKAADDTPAPSAKVEPPNDAK